SRQYSYLSLPHTPPASSYSYTPPPPPPSTLFPYTTLFRSRQRLRNPKTSSPEESFPSFQEEGKESQESKEGSGIRRGRIRAAGRDRKSTRLNSSHVSISYAVFCLKKKKNKEDRRRNEKHNA